MNAKAFNLIGILVTLVLSLTLTSAADVANVSIVSVSGLSGTVTQGSSFTLTLNISNNYGETLNFNLTNSTDSGIIFTSLTNGNLSIENGSSGLIYATVKIPSNFIGPATKTITVSVNNATTGANIGTETTTVSYVVPSSSCDYGEKGTLKIKEFSIDNQGDGDDSEWNVLDKVVIDVEVENTNNDDDVTDVLVEIKILDETGSDVTGEFDFDDETIDLGRINNDDSEIATFTITEVPVDLDGNYQIYIKSYSDGAEETQCASTSTDFDGVGDSYQKIEVVREDDPAVIVKQIDLKVLASCSDKNVPITFKVYNIGLDKEKKVLVNLQNTELRIDENYVIDGLSSGNEKEATFYINLPETLSKNKYDLEITTYFDYDKDEDENDLLAYGSDSDTDLGKDYSVRLEILGCKLPEPTVAVSLASEGPKMNQELVVKAVVKNNGPEAKFTFTASEFDSWANLVSVTPQTVTIAKGQSTEILFTVLPTDFGSKTFNINTIVDGETYSQPVSVNVATDKESGIFDSMDSTTVYLIIGIAVLVLLILVIVLVKAFSSKSKKAVSY